MFFRVGWYLCSHFFCGFLQLLSSNNTFFVRSVLIFKLLLLQGSVKFNLLCVLGPFHCDLPCFSLFLYLNRQLQFKVLRLSLLKPHFMFCCFYFLKSNCLLLSKNALFLRSQLLICLFVFNGSFPLIGHDFGQLLLFYFIFNLLRPSVIILQQNLLQVLLVLLPFSQNRF